MEKNKGNKRKKEKNTKIHYKSITDKIWIKNCFIIEFIWCSREELFTISTVKNLVVKTRRAVKLIAILIISALVISCLFLFVYRPIYAVSLNGEFIGYSENKTKLQNKINEYMESGDGGNVAFVQIDDMPEYQICLLKKDIITNDDEIFEKVISNGTTYYEYYALTVEEEEKDYVSSYDDAKDVIDQLKDKGSNNLTKLGMVKKYSTELAEFTDTASAVDDLYEKPVVVQASVTNTSTGKDSFRRGVNTTSKKIDLGINLIRPISGIITSRFGYRSSGLHTGLDIAASKGTPIKAVADGVVTYSGTSSTGYGKYVVISHGGGIQTYYCHCSALYVEAGEEVAQGEVIAAVGSTGNSTGPHLHLEIRANGVCQNPQNYLY